MALNIKDPETDRLARRLAELTGESITVALKRAVSDRIATVERTALPKADLTEIIERGRARRPLNDLTEDEILGYGPDGLPQ